MIRRLLVANRGEIARRVFATCRRMGVETVAVHSDAEADAPYVAEADFAVRLPGNAAAETYLRGDLMIAAARESGADTVHPGYGFLAENADFAAAVADAGLTWVGPPAKVIAALGSKIEAKARLAEAGVPMLPTYTDPGQVGEFPVLVKASAGGGGRGMRVVRDAASLPEAIGSARREAAAAFGDGRVFIERYVERARHVEVQVFGDEHGNVVSLGERECSIQRRHQKIIEEAPSAAVTPELRAALRDAATAAARAVGYVGAGTVEFLLDLGANPGGAGAALPRGELDLGGNAGAAPPRGEFFFLEMNTRLQVEHAVTECVSGLDLVRLQLLVAEGGSLPVVAPPVNGHAIEVRLCAEDPGNAWSPATGTLHRFAVPDVSARFEPLARSGLRLDSGVGDGSLVGVHYDSMLAKLVAWAPTRQEAARLLAGALRRAEIHGVLTNRDLLVSVLRHPSFGSADIDTRFLDRHPEVFAPLVSAPEQVAAAGLAAALAGAAARRHAAPVLRSLPSGWRNVPTGLQSVGYDTPTGPLNVGYRLDRAGGLADWSAEFGTGPGRPVGPGADRRTDPGAGSPAGLGGAARGLGGAAGRLGGAAGCLGGAAGGRPSVRLLNAGPDRVVLEVDGVRQAFAVHLVAGVAFVDGPQGSLALTERPRFAEPAPELAEGSLLAPLPGAISRVLVAPGQRVGAGELLMTLEAMKLEHPIRSPSAGVVADVPVSAGSQVDTGAVLAVLSPE